MASELNLIEMELREVQLKGDALGVQVIVLGEVDGSREFPILIGYAEAIALDLALHGERAPRPMTHDLIYNTLEGLGAELRHIIVDDLRDDVFYAKLVVRTAAGTEELIDSRPSDAIVLAAKRRLRIFVNEPVLEKVLHDGES